MPNRATFVSMAYIPAASLLEPMPRIYDLLARVSLARKNYMDVLETLSSAQGAFKPSDDSWSAAEISEHLVYAEYGGVTAVWKALDGIRRGVPAWHGEHVNRGLPIEEIIARTWRAAEAAPKAAGPRLGGPLTFWLDALASCHLFTERLAHALEDTDLEEVVYPHPISGPMDAGQRFEFLAFHLDRHRGQIERLMAHPDFPAADSEPVAV